MEPNTSASISIPILKRAKTVVDDLRVVDDLPDEILINIFHKLSIDSLGPCMCVKKPWLSLIKSTPFISSYKTPDRYFIFYKNSQELLIHRDNDEFEFHQQFTFPIKMEVKFDSEVEILVCNGVLCFAMNESTIILWNPAIRKMLTLPQPNLLWRGTYNRGLPVLGFWFDSAASDYKVVRILNTFRRVNMYQYTEDPGIEVFSFNKNSWRTVSAPPRYFFGKNSLPVPILNGVLHWECDNFTSDASVIMGFDLNAELFREIDFPNSLDQSITFFKLAVYKESFISICCTDKSDNNDIDIWVMKEYGNVESWTQIWKSNSVALQSARGIHRFTCILGFRNNGEVLVWHDDESHIMIVSVNPETGEENQLAITTPEPDVMLYYEWFQYFEKSLVLLENANAVSCPPIGDDGERINHTEEYDDDDDDDSSSDSSDVSNASDDSNGEKSDGLSSE